MSARNRTQVSLERIFRENAKTTKRQRKSAETKDEEEEEDCDSHSSSMEGSLLSSSYPFSDSVSKTLDSINP